MDTLSPFERALRRSTAQITAFRFQLENERMRMARLIEIKGLGADIAGIKAGIGELRAAAGQLNSEKAGLTAEIKDLTEQLKQHRADLRFEAETLGNSSGGTESEETKTVSTASTDRVALGAHPDLPDETHATEQRILKEAADTASQTFQPVT